LVIMRTVLELIAELEDHDEAEGDRPASDAEQGGDEHRPTVLCAAGRSGLDLAVAAMLGQLLERRGFATRVLSADALAPEHLPAVNLERVDVICLSYLESNVLPRVRQTVRRLIRHSPQMPVLVGLWTLPQPSRTHLGQLSDRA